MKKTEVGELSCKILSIYTFSGALSALQFPIAMRQPGIMNRPSTWFILASFIPATLLLLFSAILWLSSKQWAASEEPVEEHPSRSSGMTLEMMQNLAFSIVGILILVNTLPYIANAIVQSLAGNPLRDRMFWVHIVEALIRLALGAWLLFGSKGLRRFKAWLLEKTVQKDW